MKDNKKTDKDKLVKVKVPIIDESGYLYNPKGKPKKTPKKK